MVASGGVVVSAAWAVSADVEVVRLHLAALVAWEDAVDEVVVPALVVSSAVCFSFVL